MSQAVCRASGAGVRDRRAWFGVVPLLLLSALLGCQRYKLRDPGPLPDPLSWQPPDRFAASAPWHDKPVQQPLTREAALAAESAGAVGVAHWERQLARAVALDQRRDPACVDFYYHIAAHTCTAAMADMTATLPSSTSWTPIYHRALEGLLDTSQRYGRYLPQGGIRVLSAGRAHIVPVRYYGFAWTSEDFSALTPANRYRSTELNRYFASTGVGSNQVAQRISSRRNDPLLAEEQTFAVTVVLRDAVDDSSTPVLEFYNPLVFDALRWNDTDLPLARDLTAAAIAMLEQTPRRYWQGFTAPTDVSVRPKLSAVEPYQPGKIPLIFVHGLYSDPITWANMIHEIQAQPDLYAQYQVWLFRYPTGGGLLDSVAALREQLTAARTQLDPHHADPALDRMVLVGHSLGGLVSKLQVTYAEDTLWRQIARRPFEELRASSTVRNRLARDFFFEPLPYVRRVVFIATPHRGSAMAQRLVGRIGSQLVRFGSEEDQQYEAVLAANPHLFRPELTTARPTSVDLLEPSSPLLRGIEALRIAPHVQLHSIIGTGGLPLLKQPGDGTVSVASARHPGVLSERYVPARHEQIHKHSDTINEMHRILRRHLLED